MDAKDNALQMAIEENKKLKAENRHLRAILIELTSDEALRAALQVYVLDSHYKMRAALTAALDRAKKLAQ